VIWSAFDILFKSPVLWPLMSALYGGESICRKGLGRDQVDHFRYCMYTVYLRFIFSLVQVITYTSGYIKVDKPSANCIT
jgi:hypothetical protein